MFNEVTMKVKAQGRDNFCNFFAQLVLDLECQQDYSQGLEKQLLSCDATNLDQQAAAKLQFLSKPHSC